jgi:hypothetical protein
MTIYLGKYFRKNLIKHYSFLTGITQNQHIQDAWPNFTYFDIDRYNSI